MTKPAAAQKKPAQPAAAQPNILLVEDEESFIQALTVGLGHESMKVSVARDGKEALDIFDDVNPDIVLLDVMLPKLTGIDVCREIRRRSSVPIVMITAKSEEVDVVVGLEVGADDYISKPYRLRELVARIRAQLRRGAERPQEVVSTTIVHGELSLDPNRHEIFLRGEPVLMPLKEFDLLWVLMSNAGQLLTREKLMRQVWGSDYFGDTKTLDVHIKRLRSKIEDTPSKPERIITIRGLGYKFNA